MVEVSAGKQRRSRLNSMTKKFRHIENVTYGRVDRHGIARYSISW